MQNPKTYLGFSVPPIGARLLCILAAPLCLEGLDAVKEHVDNSSLRFGLTVASLILGLVGIAVVAWATIGISRLLGRGEEEQLR